jgi:hypothetical protein
MYSPNPYSNRRPTYKARIVRLRNKGPAEPQRLGRAIALSLLTTCRQLHAECSPVLYGGNVFRIGPSNDIETSLVYRQLVQHIIFIADVDLRLYKTNLDEVNYGWKRRLWPSIVNGGAGTLARYPNIETLTVILASPNYGQPWRPAFFAVRTKTKEQRISLAVQWLQTRCPLENERLRACLRMEVNPPVLYSKHEFIGSKFAPDEDDESDWDCTEFAEAFKIVMNLP